MCFCSMYRSFSNARLVSVLGIFGEDGRWTVKRSCKGQRGKRYPGKIYFLALLSNIPPTKYTHSARLPPQTSINDACCSSHHSPRTCNTSSCLSVAHRILLRLLLLLFGLGLWRARAICCAVLLLLCWRDVTTASLITLHNSN